MLLSSSSDFNASNASMVSAMSRSNGAMEQSISEDARIKGARVFRQFGSVFRWWKVSWKK